MKTASNTLQFVEITPEEFRKFAEKSPYQSFMQTPEIAKLRETDGWTAHYLAAKAGNNIKAATLLVSKPNFLGKSTFLAPGGPLLDFEDKTLTKFFLKNLKDYVKNHNGYSLQISPYYELIERGRNGEKIEGGFNRSSAIKTLLGLNFKATAHTTQPKYLFVMDIKGRSSEELFADQKRNTRNHVRKAEKMGVKIRELNREELSILKDITEKTSKRRGFTDRPLSYYEQMYDLFHSRGEVKFLVAEADSIPLSAAMFMLTGDEIVYLFSGSDEQYMHDYNAQYLIQWHIIKYAAENGFKRYNFYGIHGLPDENHKDGIYDFKKGFDSRYGHVVELIGAFETSVNTPVYKFRQFLSKLKNLKP